MLHLRALVFFAASTAFGANIVLNPGIESGTTSWTTNGWSADDGTNGSGVTPHTGTQYMRTGCVGIGSLDPLTGCSFYQDLATTAGQTYTLSFWYNLGSLNQVLTDGLFQGFVSSPNDTAVVQAYWDGVQVFEASANVGAPTWLFASFDVVANSSTTRLLFTGRQDPAQLGVDDISVDAKAAAVPEPGSILLIGSGLLGLGLIARRKA
jgi:hypothetical protein